jgi:hypothetical protein
MDAILSKMGYYFKVAESLTNELSTSIWTLCTERDLDGITIESLFSVLQALHMIKLKTKESDCSGEPKEFGHLISGELSITDS